MIHEVDRGLPIFDADMHIIEPVDLWERYIPAAFRDRAPRFSVPEYRLTLEGMSLPTARPIKTKGFKG